MDVIIYVETNFLMSVAMGREARGDDLLAAVSASVRVAIPSGCYMESLSAFEDEKGRRNWFRDEIEKQIKQLRRDTTSANADTLLAHLEESRIADNTKDFNTAEVLACLAAIGINRPFRTVDNVLGWLGSL